MNERYLDAAATAPLRPEARAAMIAVFDESAGNPSSVHTAGHRAARTVELARQTIATTFGVRASDVIFTSGGTEANNLAIIGLALAHPRGRHLVTTPIEHPSVLESCRYLERVFGYELTMLPVDELGRVDPDDVTRAVRADTTLVSIGLANAEVGTVQPMPALAAAAKQVGAIVHTDAVQAAPSLPVTLQSQGWPGDNVDALSMASHKFGGPQGVGALIVRDGLRLEPLMHGGGQELGRRAGTENVAGLAGFAAAVAATAHDYGGRALALIDSRNALVERVTREVSGARVTGHPTERLPGHASFTFEGVSGESLLVALDASGIAVSAGSACAAGKSEPSPALLALGLDPETAQTALRITLAEPIAEELQHRVVTTLQREVG
ncbi:cysteine desulfurase family protein [Leucobacter salsicius]|uniref:cysteine desulfurase family protein n=1 Tax=Leucobacter salsicius TaxID=664638 RepID=UPI000347EBBC|nr:cysteine desulfurase family protein [Leucobacter salsicius]